MLSASFTGGENGNPYMKLEVRESLEDATSEKNRLIPDLGINIPGHCSEPMDLAMTVLLQY